VREGSERKQNRVSSIYSPLPNPNTQTHVKGKSVATHSINRKVNHLQHVLRRSQSVLPLPFPFPLRTSRTPTPSSFTVVGRSSTLDDEQDELSEIGDDFESGGGGFDFGEALDEGGVGNAVCEWNQDSEEV